MGSRTDSRNRRWRLDGGDYDPGVARRALEVAELSVATLAPAEVARLVAALDEVRAHVAALGVGGLQEVAAMTGR